MSDNLYEKHIVPDPSKPYIFHERHGALYICPHWHENIELLRFYTNGIVICDRTSYEVKAGDIAVFSSNALHSIPQERSAEYDCLIVNSSFLIENDIDPAKIEFDCVISDERARELFDAAVSEITSKDSFRAAGAKAAILTFMVCLCRNWSKPLDVRETRSIVRRAIGYINSNLSSDMTIDEIAENTTVSKYYLCREFRRETGFTVVRYINDLRCREAERLLKRSDATVSEIARSLGYDNLSYFTRTFRSITGKKPSEVRKGQ